MTVPFACDMTAIPDDQRPIHHEMIRRLLSRASIADSADGFVFELPAHKYDAATVLVVVQFERNVEK